MFGFGFKFLDPGPLVDGELSLVAPAMRWVDDLLEAERMSGTLDLEALRERTEQFIQSNPGGRQKADRIAGKVPSYHFWMKVDHRHPAGWKIPVLIAGGIGLRIGRNEELELYSGHIGYHVYEPARGHHFAERAARLLLPLAARHRVDPVWITCNPDNIASRRTIERLGGKFVEVVDVPEDHPFYSRGETQKCRYRIG